MKSLSLFQNLQYSTRQWLLKHKAQRKIVITTLCIALLATAYTQDAQTYYALGLEKQQALKFNEAVVLFNKAVELNPAHTLAWVDKGFCEINLMRYKDAISDLDHAIKIDSTNARAWFNQGDANTAWQTTMARYQIWIMRLRLIRTMLSLIF